MDLPRDLACIQIKILSVVLCFQAINLLFQAFCGVHRIGVGVIGSSFGYQPSRMDAANDTIL